MKQLLLLLVFLTSLSKAQNDSITFFVYTDYNSNCIYEPGIGEEPLSQFGMEFSYKFTSGLVQSNTKTTDSNGNVKFYATGAMAPASNTVSIAGCNQLNGFAQIPNCFFPQDLSYNNSYSIPVYGLNGIATFNFLNVFVVAPVTYNVINPVGYEYYCIGSSSFQSGSNGANYLSGNMLFESLTLTIQGGSTNTQMLVGSTMSSGSGCAFSSAGFPNFTNPELQIPGIYTVTVSGGSYANTIVLIVDSCSSQSGNVFVDCNSNCNQNVSEYGSSDITLFSTNNTYSISALPDYNGNFSFYSPYSSSQYTLNISAQTDFSLACSTPSAVTYYSNSSTNYNIAPTELNQTAANNINYTSYLEHPYGGSSVPGGSFKFNSYYYVAHPDYCSLVNNSGTYYIKLDPSVQFVSVDPNTPNYTAIYPSSTGDSIVWSIADLRQSAMNLGGHQFVLNLFMKVTANIGTNYCFKTGVISQVTETTFADNVANACWLIGGPFDPNYIEVTPKGTGVQGYIPTSTTELLYTIHFQNVGTAPAVNVKIKNLLDGNIDNSSLKVIGSSFPVQTNIDANGMVTFMFNNILLADSTHDEPNSHGFVSYKINLKPSLAAGTQINNTAAIYFDYNAAVLTNTVLNTLQTATGVKELNSGSFAVYPNPSNGLVTVSSNDVINKVVVINVLGEVVKTMIVDSKQITVDMTDLKPNVYFLQITDAKNQTSVKKIVKE